MHISRNRNTDISKDESMQHLYTGLRCDGRNVVTYTRAYILVCVCARTREGYICGVRGVVSVHAYVAIIQRVIFACESVISK